MVHAFLTALASLIALATVRPDAHWHKRCFTCASCKKGLDSSTLAEHDGEIFCKSCHGKQFGPTGFGHGLGTETVRGAPKGLNKGEAPSGPGPARESFSKPAAEPATDSSADTSSAAPSAPKPSGPDICPRCGKKAYAAERVRSIVRGAVLWTGWAGVRGRGRGAGAGASGGRPFSRWSRHPTPSHATDPAPPARVVP